MPPPGTDDGLELSAVVGGGALLTAATVGADAVVADKLDVIVAATGQVSLLL